MANVKGVKAKAVSQPQTVAWVRPALVALAVVLVFWPVCTFDFTSWDDDKTVCDNAALNPPTVSSIASFWAKPYGDLYIPLTYSVWGAIASMAGVSPEPGTGIQLNPYLFHTANLLLHLASALVAYRILLILIGRYWPACAGAVLFAIHPVQVEAVAWMSGLKDLLAGLFSLLAVWQYLVAVARNAGTNDLSIEIVGTVNRGTHSKSVPSIQTSPGSRFYFRRYLAATVFFLLALLSKPSSAAATVAVVGVLDLLLLRRSLRSSVCAVAPWVLLAIPFLYIAHRVQPGHLGGSIPLIRRPLIAADALTFYMAKVLWPARLCIDYGRTPAMVLAGRLAWFTWIIPAALVATIWCLGKRCASALGRCSDLCRRPASNARTCIL